METTISPTRRLAFLLAPLLALVGLNALADAHEPPPPGTLESFLCTYVDGKDRDDLDSAIEFHMKQAAKGSVATPTSYLWTKMKGTNDAQLIWHTGHENLAAFGAQMDAENASSEIAAANDRYNSVVSCTPMLANVTQVHQRGESDGGEGGFVASYACRTRAAPNPAAFGDLNRHIKGVLGDMDNASPLATYGLGLITADPRGPNAVYFNVFDNVSHWTSFENQLNGTADGQMLVRHFTSMLECSTNLWTSERVVGEG